MEAGDFDPAAQPTAVVDDKIADAARFLQSSQRQLERAGYTVQTVRIATNPFGEWLVDRQEDKLKRLDGALEANGIAFCAVGPARTIEEVSVCVSILRASERFSCSAALRQNDVATARACARTVQRIAEIRTEANFRFCVAAAAKPCIPFFPVAKSDGHRKFALGLENGALAHKLLSECGSISRIPTVFREGMARALEPLQRICESIMEKEGFEFVGIDASLNPSLEEGGSVAKAIETLEEVGTFGGPGTLAAAATITQSLQSLSKLKCCGYSGLMLPTCEDQRLAELSLPITKLLSISQVCGVGIDTVPIPGNCSEKELASLLLDVAGIAHRWDKSLSCRVFPVATKEAGDWTAFDSPYMVNSKILPLS